MASSVSPGLLVAVHPHACGEIIAWGLSTCPPCGTSPRLWGTFAASICEPSFLRYIPTPVGRLARFVRTDIARAVHPHACGEISKGPETELRGHGTSPRLWGTLCVSGFGQRHRRFIPTPVGNIHMRVYGESEKSVHPHTRGEHPTGEDDAR